MRTSFRQIVPFLLVTFLLGSGYLFLSSEACAEDASIEGLRSKAEQGDAVAQYNLAVAYAKGESVPQDSKEAMKWYREAAEQGHAEAQYVIAGMYYFVKGPQGYKEAMKWYREAAEQGHAEAQLALGIMYLLGKSIPLDYVKAYAWINLGVAQGEDSKVRDKVVGLMTPEQISEGQKLSAQLYEKIESSK